MNSVSLVPCWGLLYFFRHVNFLRDASRKPCEINWAVRDIMEIDSSWMWLRAHVCGHRAVQKSKYKNSIKPGCFSRTDYSSREVWNRRVGTSSRQHPHLSMIRIPSCCAAPSPPCLSTSCFCWWRCSTRWRVRPCTRRGTFRSWCAAPQPRQPQAMWMHWQPAQQPATITAKRHTPPAPGA